MHVFCFSASLVIGKFWENKQEAACLRIITYRLAETPHWHLLETPGKGIGKEISTKFFQSFLRPPAAFTSIEALARGKEVFR